MAAQTPLSDPLAMTPDLNGLTRIHTGTWQINDWYRARAGQGDWMRILYYQCITIDDYKRTWPTPEVWRYVPPSAPPQWIRSKDRSPLKTDLPILVDNGSCTSVYRTVPVHQHDVPYLWIRWQEPSAPAPTQRDLDDAAFMAIECCPPRDVWHKAVAYGRANPARV